MGLNPDTTGNGATTLTNDSNHHRRTTAKTITIVARLISYLVYFYVIVVEVLLFFGFFLLLLGANQSAGFAQFVYRSVDRAMKPFRGLFTPIELGTTSGNQVESVFETSVLFAMIVYGVVALAIGGLVHWLTFRLQRIEHEEQTEDALERAHQRAVEQARIEAQARVEAEAAYAAARAPSPAPAASPTPATAPTRPAATPAPPGGSAQPPPPPTA